MPAVGSWLEEHVCEERAPPHNWQQGRTWVQAPFHTIIPLGAADLSNISQLPKRGTDPLTGGMGEPWCEP